MSRVQGVVTRDTQRNITDLVNDSAEANGLGPSDLLALLIGESGLDEHAIREGAWPDVSYGLPQVIVATAGGWGVGDGSNTTRNRAQVRDFLFDAGNAIPFAARIFAHYRDAARAAGEINPELPPDSPLAWMMTYNHGHLPTVDETRWYRGNKANYEAAIRSSRAYMERTIVPIDLVELNQFERRHYHTEEEWRRLRGASCSAATLASALNLYGIEANISEALRRIRATGDDVLANGLQNRNGQGQALADALSDAGISSRVYPWASFTRHTFMDWLDAGRPVLCQMLDYWGDGHYLGLDGVLEARDGVTVADSNAGDGKRSLYYWDGPPGVGLWNDMQGGVAIVPDNPPAVELGEDPMQIEALRREVSGLTQAVAYLADDVADRVKTLAAHSNEEAAAVEREAQRVREQFVGPRPAA